MTDYLPKSKPTLTPCDGDGICLTTRAPYGLDPKFTCTHGCTYKPCSNVLVCKNDPMPQWVLDYTPLGLCIKCVKAELGKKRTEEVERKSVSDGEQPSMTKKELIRRLNALAADTGDQEVTHYAADALLLDYINNEAVSTAYGNIPKWYA